MSEQGVKREIEEKHTELRQQYAGEMKSFWKKKRREIVEFIKNQRIEYTEFFKNCPQSGRYAGAIIVGTLIGKFIL